MQYLSEQKQIKLKQKNVFIKKSTFCWVWKFMGKDSVRRIID